MGVRSTSPPGDRGSTRLFNLLYKYTLYRDRLYTGYPDKYLKPVGLHVDNIMTNFIKLLTVKIWVWTCLYWCFTTLVLFSLGYRGSIHSIAGRTGVRAQDSSSKFVPETSSLLHFLDNTDLHFPDHTILHFLDNKNLHFLDNTITGLHFLDDTNGKILYLFNILCYIVSSYIKWVTTS